jgi:energy-coupling factor transporter ATP-binding protein EcfA2
MTFVFLTPAEEKQLVSVISDIRDRALVRLMLDTGLFMAELQHLTFPDLYIEKKEIKVTGPRSRIIPLNDELVLLLEDYLRTRPQCGLQELFLTGRGKPAPLSHRAIDKMLTKYQLKANLAKKVNTIVLRNTFAVKLCLAEVTFDKLTAILGVSNGDTIERYVRAAKTLGVTPELSKAVEKLDTRSTVKKAIDKLKPKQPVYVPEQRTVNTVIEKNFFGRDQLLIDIRRDLGRKQSVLVIGPYGAGKTALVKEVAGITPEGTLRDVLQSIVPGANKRMSVTEMLKALPGETVIPIDNIDRLRLDNLEQILRAIGEHTFLLTAEKLTNKLLRFQQQVNIYHLNKLADQELQQLITNYLPQLVIADGQQEILRNRIIMLSNGNPGTAVHLLQKLSCQPRITDNHIRELSADNPDNVRDWSNIMIIAFSVVIALRYISRGTGDTELYLLSGIIYAFFLSLKVFGGRRST